MIKLLMLLLLFLDLCFGIVWRTEAFVPSSTPTIRTLSDPCHPQKLKLPTTHVQSQLSTRDLFKMSSSPSSSQTTIPLVIQYVGSTTSLVVAGTFFAVLCWKRNALMVTFFLGSILNGILSKLLKKLLNQERPGSAASTTPPPTLLVVEQPGDKGMPSSHAMSLGFIGVFTGLVLPQTQLLILAYVAISLYYRVRTQLHSLDQIVVGLVLGSIHGYLWFCNRTPMMEFMSTHILTDPQGLLPIPLLVVPALVGTVVVGSVERRISKWIRPHDNNNPKSE